MIYDISTINPNINPSCTVVPGASQKIPGSVERAAATGAGTVGFAE